MSQIAFSFSNSLVFYTSFNLPYKKSSFCPIATRQLSSHFHNLTRPCSSNNKYNNGDRIDHVSTPATSATNQTPSANPTSSNPKKPPSVDTIDSTVANDQHNHDQDYNHDLEDVDLDESGLDDGHDATEKENGLPDNLTEKQKYLIQKKRSIKAINKEKAKLKRRQMKMKAPYRPITRKPLFPKLEPLSDDHVKQYFANFQAKAILENDYDKKRNIYDSPPSIGTLALVNNPMFADCILQVKSNIYFGHSKFLVMSSQWFEEWFLKNDPHYAENAASYLEQRKLQEQELRKNLQEQSDQDDGHNHGNDDSQVIHDDANFSQDDLDDEAHDDTIVTLTSDNDENDGPYSDDAQDDSSSDSSTTPNKRKALNYVPSSLKQPIVINLDDIPGTSFLEPTLMLMYSNGRASFSTKLYGGVQQNLRFLKCNVKIQAEIAQMIEAEKVKQALISDRIFQREGRTLDKKLEKKRAELAAFEATSRAESKADTAKTKASKATPNYLSYSQLNLIMEKSGLDLYERTSMLILWGMRVQKDKDAVRDSIRRLIGFYVKNTDNDKDQVLERLKELRNKLPAEFEDCFPADVFLDLM